MSVFSRDFSVPLADLADYFGGEVSYLRGAVPLPMRWAILTEETEEEVAASTGRTRIKVRWMQVVTDPRSDRYCGVSRIERDRVVTVGSTRYVVGSVSVTPWGSQNVKLRQVSQAERSRPGLRGRDRSSGGGNASTVI